MKTNTIKWLTNKLFLESSRYVSLKCFQVYTVLMALYGKSVITLTVFAIIVSFSANVNKLLCKNNE